MQAILTPSHISANIPGKTAENGRIHMGERIQVQDSGFGLALTGSCRHLGGEAADEDTSATVYPCRSAFQINIE